MYVLFALCWKAFRKTDAVIGFAVRAVKKAFAAAGRDEWKARAAGANFEAAFATVEMDDVSRNGWRIGNAMVDCI
jgi:hypothetical protein